MPTQVTVTGTFQSAPGVPAQGYVVWQLSNELFDTNGNLVCTTAPLTFNLVNGVMTAVVWANDDPTVQPTGTHWTVSVYVNSGKSANIPLVTLISQNNYVLAHTSTSVNMASLPVAQVTPAMQSSVTQLTAGSGISITGGDGAGHGALTIASSGGGGGLPAPVLTTGWQPGFGVTSGQNFVMPSGTTSMTYPFDTAYTLENSTGVGATTLTDDQWMHWDPATPKQFTVKRTGWYWVNWSVDIGPLGLASAVEWLIQPSFGFVNKDVIIPTMAKIGLFTNGSTLGYIVGPQTCSLTIAMTSGQTNSTNFNISEPPTSQQMILIPLFS